MRGKRVRPAGGEPKSEMELGSLTAVFDTAPPVDKRFTCGYTNLDERRSTDLEPKT